MLKRALPWADVAAVLAVLGVALFVRPHTIAWFTGLIIGGVTFALWVVARIQLGSAFSLRAEAHHLVTHGLYSKIRHPIYLFGSAALLGALLALQIWPILAVGIALTPIELVRARREDSVLRATFGEEYERYRRSTWF